MTVHQQDNYGRKAVAYLPELHIDGPPNPVVQIVREAGDEVIYTLRIRGNTFRPKVFENGLYTVRIGEGENLKTLRGIKALAPNEKMNLKVTLN